MRLQFGRTLILAPFVAARTITVSVFVSQNEFSRQAGEETISVLVQAPWCAYRYSLIGSPGGSLGEGAVVVGKCREGDHFSIVSSDRSTGGCRFLDFSDA
jgi:hypothetical protein